MSAHQKVEKINLASKFDQFNDYWNPRIIGELNNQQVRIVKFRGEFSWHKHEHEDELFLVIDGEFTMHLEDEKILLKAGEFLIIPRGTMHMPVAEHEVKVMLFEPSTLVNTGNKNNPFTRNTLEKI
jgi:mannose-6-phosphate isomerase-like protein (cupin superfamily)